MPNKSKSLKKIKINPLLLSFINFFLPNLLIKKISSEVPCYIRCLTCSITGDSSNHNCDSCDTNSDYFFLPDIESQCYTRTEAEAYGSFYVNIATNRFEKCHEACLKCSDGNIPTDQRNRCMKCNEGYYRKEDSVSASIFNCYQPFNIENNYFKDTLSTGETIFKKCYKKCNTCSRLGNDDNHLCDSCKIGNNEEDQYYKLDSEDEGNCYLLSEIPSDYEIPLNHVLNQRATDKLNERNGISSSDDENYAYIYDFIAMRCYNNCLTCTKYGDEDNMHCITCKSGLFFYKNNCYKKCPKPDTYQLKDNNYMCKELVEGYKIVTDYKTSNDIVDFLLYHGLGEFDFEKNLITANKIYGQIYSWKNKNTNDDLADKLKLSKIEINDKCFNKIIKNYNITQDIIEDIIMIKLDRNYSNSRSNYRSSVNQVDFYLFYPYYEYDIISGEKILNGTYTEISISICSDEESEVKIIKPLINTDETATGVELSKANKIHQKYNQYDLFKSQNIFFTDICAIFKSEEGNKDVELQERRDKYYQNISFCEGNCIFEGLDYDELTVTCDCNAAEFLTSEQYNDIQYKDRKNRIKNLTFSTLANTFPKNSSDSYITLNRKTMQCKHLIYDLDMGIKNIANYLAFFLLIAKSVIFVYFIREKFKPINDEYNKRKEKIELEILEQVPDAKIMTEYELSLQHKYHIEKIVWSNYAGAFKYDKSKKTKKKYGVKEQENAETNKFTYNGLLMNKNHVEINKTEDIEDNNNSNAKDKKTTGNPPPKRLGYVFNEEDERQKDNEVGHINNRNNVFKQALKDMNYTMKEKNNKKFFKEEENKTSFFNALYPTSKETLNELNNDKNDKDDKNEKDTKITKITRNSNKKKSEKKTKRRHSFVNPEKMDKMINDFMPPDYDKIEVDLNDKISPPRNSNLKFNPAKLNQIINEEHDFKKDQKARREFNEDKAIQEENRLHRNKMKEKNHDREPEDDKEIEQKLGKKGKKIKKKKFGNQNYLEDPNEVAKYKKAYLDDDDIGDKNAFSIEPAINYRFCSMTSPEKLIFMKYNYALDLDRRTFMEIYMSCVKMSQLIMNFIYIPYYHNMKFLKLYFMMFVINLNIFTTTIFYSHYYISSMYGYKIFMCILQSIFISFMLFLFSFSKKKFTGVHVLDIQKLKCYKKLYIFIVISAIAIEFAFSGLIWFWSSALCAVYQNSDFFYLLHVLESIVITLALPFLFSFIPATLRYMALVHEKRILFLINNYVDMLF